MSSTTHLTTELPVNFMISNFEIPRRIREAIDRREVAKYFYVSNPSFEEFRNEHHLMVWNRNGGVQHIRALSEFGKPNRLFVRNALEWTNVVQMESFEGSFEDDEPMLIIARTDKGDLLRTILGNFPQCSTTIIKRGVKTIVQHARFETEDDQPMLLVLGFDSVVSYFTTLRTAPTEVIVNNLPPVVDIQGNGTLWIVASYTNQIYFFGIDERYRYHDTPKKLQIPDYLENAKFTLCLVHSMCAVSPSGQLYFKFIMNGKIWIQIKLFPEPLNECLNLVMHFNEDCLVRGVSGCWYKPLCQNLLTFQLNNEHTLRPLYTASPAGVTPLDYFLTIHDKSFCRGKLITVSPMVRSSFYNQLFSITDFQRLNWIIQTDQRTILRAAIDLERFFRQNRELFGEYVQCLERVMAQMITFLLRHGQQLPNFGFASTLRERIFQFLFQRTVRRLINNW